MSSPFSPALTKLDGSLQTIQSQLDCLRAGLEVNADQLSHSLTDARQHAATLRDLIRAERPDASWIDRMALDQLIHELEIAAEARRNEQRRTKLLDLANELDAGRVKHRFDARTTALNALRLEAIKELRTEAGLSGQVKDLPGPNASEWLHWVCSLQDAKDASVVTNLRRDFGAVERFAGEMEENYWIPAQRVHTRHASESSARAAEEPEAESLASPSSEPVALVDTDQDKLPQKGRAQFDEAIQSGNYAIDPIDNLALRVTSDSIPGTATRDTDLLLKKTAEGGQGPAVAEAHLPMEIVPSPEPADLEPTEQPSVDPSGKPAKMEIAELRAELRQSSATSVSPLSIVRRRKRVVAWVVAIIIVVLGAIFGVSYYFKTTTSSRSSETAATAVAKVDGVIQDADIQKDVEQRLTALKGSFIQVKVQNGIVTLICRSSSEEDLVKAEALASRAGGVKGVRYEVQVEARDADISASSAKRPEQNRAASVSFDSAPPNRRASQH